MPEFEMPKPAAPCMGYPDLASGQAHTRWSGAPDAEMDPTREETYKFIDKFMEEMADFPRNISISAETKLQARNGKSTEDSGFHASTA